MISIAQHTTDKNPPFLYPPSHDLGYITWNAWPYYNTSQLVEYIEETIEKPYGIGSNDIVINVYMKKKHDGKKLLHGNMTLTLDGASCSLPFDFRTWSLPAQLWSLEQRLKTFITTHRSTSGQLTRTLQANAGWRQNHQTAGKIHPLSPSTKTSHSLIKSGDIITFPDGSRIDTTHITLQDLEQHPDCWAIYWANAQNILWWWQAWAYGSAPNSFAITTRPDLRWYYTDADFDTLKPRLDQEFDAIYSWIESGKPIIIPADGVWGWFAKLDVNAPKILAYINDKLDIVKQKNAKYWLIQSHLSQAA